MNYYYCFTLRNLIEPKPEPIMDTLTLLKRNMPTSNIEYHFEIVYKRNGNHNLHIHGMITSTRSIYGKMLRRLVPEGIYFYFEPLRTSKQVYNIYASKQGLRTLEDVYKKLDFYNNLIYDDMEEEQQQEENLVLTKRLVTLDNC